MPAERYFVPDDLQVGQTVAIEGLEGQHLVKVMRGRVGDPVSLFNGRGQLASGQVVSTGKGRAAIELLTVDQQPRPSQRLILAQGIARMNRLETAIEKITELGVTDIWLFAAERSERTVLSPQHLRRLEALMVAACKQSGRLWLPSLQIVDAIKRWGQFDGAGYFGSLDSNAPQLMQLINESQQPVGDRLFVVGPESGLTANEEEALKAQGLVGVSLHPNVLRTETAAIAGIVLLSSRW